MVQIGVTLWLSISPAVPMIHLLICGDLTTSTFLYCVAWSRTNVVWSTSRWCGTSGSIADSYQESIDAFSALPVASYLSEYGCNTDTPRTWTEVPAIYGTQMSAVYSGGVAFSYFPTNDPKSFGMVTINGNTVNTSADFTNLAAALTNVTLPTTPAQSAVTTLPLSTCPAIGDEWLGSTQVSTQVLSLSSQNEALILLASAHSQPSGMRLHLELVPLRLLSSDRQSIGSLRGFVPDKLYVTRLQRWLLRADWPERDHWHIRTCVLLRWRWVKILLRRVGWRTENFLATKLTWVFSQFYLATENNAQSCNFAGNATINSASPTTASAVNAAVTSCFAETPSVYTPLTPTTTLAPGEHTSGPDRKSVV